MTLRYQEPASRYGSPVKNCEPVTPRVIKRLAAVAGIHVDGKRATRGSAGPRKNAVIGGSAGWRYGALNEAD